MFSFAFTSRLAMNIRSRLLAWLPALVLGPMLALCSTLAQAEAPAEAAIADLRREAVDLAIAGAGKVIERNLDDASNRQIVEKFLASVPITPASR